MDETKNEKSPKRTRRLLKNVSSTFSESATKLMPYIRHPLSASQKIIQVFVILVLIIGFIYQCSVFLTFVLRYPTVVDITVERVDAFDAPAFTFCNNNRIKRSKFCSTYPNKCMEPNATFCQNHSTYCGSGKIFVPKEDFYGEENEMGVEEMKNMTYKAHDLLNVNLLVEDPKGPYMRQNGRGNARPFPCYTLYSRSESSADPWNLIHKPLEDSPVAKLLFLIRESETFNPGNQPGILFSAHSPFDDVNPFDDGVFLKPGRMYKVLFTMRKEKSLPYPYETNCTDYAAIWKANNKTGPRSQKTCKEKCILDVTLKCYNCVKTFVLHPSKEKPCTKPYESNCPPYLLNFEMNNCFSKCGVDCMRIKYQYEFREGYNIERWIPKSIPWKPQDIYVEVYLKDPEMVTLFHKAQYQEVEIFSYIGGFIGIWLGVSFIQVVGFVENVIKYFAIKKKLEAHSEDNEKSVQCSSEL